MIHHSRAPPRCQGFYKGAAYWGCHCGVKQARSVFPVYRNGDIISTGCRASWRLAQSGCRRVVSCAFCAKANHGLAARSP